MDGHRPATGGSLGAPPTSGTVIADSEARREAAAVWRCAVSDMIGAFDASITHPLKNSRRRSERDLGDKIDAIMHRLFRASYAFDPGEYREAMAAGKQLIAIAKESNV